jgi:hypothetical protein
MTSSSYEIRVTGILPPGALRDFEDLAPSVKPVETLVHGQLPDQAALHGLLARLEMLGVQILEVRRLHDRNRPAQLAPGAAADRPAASPRTRRPPGPGDAWPPSPSEA